MAYLNRNYALNQLEVLVETAIQQNNSFFPDSFNTAQLEAVEIFRKRIFLESIIEESISFNQNLSWDNTNNNLRLATTAEELLEVFKLRSDVYHEIGYQYECPDTIEGLNFDKFDKNSAIIYYKSNGDVTGTIRLIFDSKEKLPSEEKLSFDNMREQYNYIGEISRNIVKNRGYGLNQEFKYLMCGIYNIFQNNNINLALSGIRKDHLKLFKKLGGVDVIKELKSYGRVNIPFLIISYNPKLASKFFKKVFLEEKI